MINNTVIRKNAITYPPVVHKSKESWAEEHLHVGMNPVVWDIFQRTKHERLEIIVTSEFTTGTDELAEVGRCYGNVLSISFPECISPGSSIAFVWNQMKWLVVVVFPCLTLMYFRSSSFVMVCLNVIL